MSTDVKPTRAEELRLKEQIELAESGHSILEKKRDSLIHEFMDLVEEAKDTKGALSASFQEARQTLAEAKAVEGRDTLEGVAVGMDHEPEVELERRNIMGVLVPRIQSGRIKTGLAERGYGVRSGSPTIDAVVDAYQELLENVIEAAELETALMKLLDEIDSTNRRVNALEERIIPERKQQLAYISQYLEENEREETFRMKKIKAKSGDEGAAEETFVCPECGNAFDTDRGRSVHRAQMH